MILKFIQSRGYFSSFSLGNPRDWTRVWWDRKAHRTLSHSKTGEVRRFGGFPFSFWDHLSKNPNYFLFLLLPSNPLSPGLTPHHICFLSPFSRPPLTVSHLYPPDSNRPSPKAHLCASFTSTALIIFQIQQRQQLVQMFQTTGNMGVGGGLNKLADVTSYCSEVDNIPESDSFRREHLQGSNWVC